MWPSFPELRCLSASRQKGPLADVEPKLRQAAKDSQQRLELLRGTSGNGPAYSIPFAEGNLGLGSIIHPHQRKGVRQLVAGEAVCVKKVVSFQL